MLINPEGCACVIFIVFSWPTGPYHKLPAPQNTKIRPAREIFIPKQVYLWGRVKSMDANVQIRSEMCV